MRRRLDMRRGSLSAGDGHAPPAALAALDDRAQPAHRARGSCAAASAARRAPPCSRSASVAGTVCSVKLHARGPGRGGREVVDAERADAVVLAGAADLDDPVRALDLGERDVAPAEAVAGAFTRKRAPAPAPTESIRVRCQSTR